MAKLTVKQQLFIEEFLQCRNATEAAKRAGYSDRTAYSIGQENLKKPDIRAAIDQRIEEKVMSANEVLEGLSEQARGDIGVFFKIVEEWTFYPLPTDDILDAVEVVEINDKGEERTRTSWCVRRVSIDPDKLVDPAYSHLLHKVSDTPRGGLTIELYSKQKALEDLGKYYALFTEKVKQEDWRDKAVEYIRNGEIEYKELAGEFGHTLAEELFRRAGIPIDSLRATAETAD